MSNNKTKKISSLIIENENIFIKLYGLIGNPMMRNFFISIIGILIILLISKKELFIIITPFIVFNTTILLIIILFGIKRGGRTIVEILFYRLKYYFSQKYIVVNENYSIEKDCIVYSKVNKSYRIAYNLSVNDNSSLTEKENQNKRESYINFQKNNNTKCNFKIISKLKSFTPNKYEEFQFIKNGFDINELPNMNSMQYTLIAESDKLEKLENSKIYIENNYSQLCQSIELLNSNQFLKLLLD